MSAFRGKADPPVLRSSVQADIPSLTPHHSSPRTANMGEIRGFCGVINRTARIGCRGHHPLTLQDGLKRRIKRGTRNDQLQRQFFPLRPDLQHVRHHRQPGLRVDRHRPVIHARDRSLVTVPERQTPKDVCHDPSDPLATVCAHQQHSGNHPCQRNCGLARNIHLFHEPNLSFIRFLAPSLPLVAHPSWR
jgi:hypothetical protein